MNRFWGYILCVPAALVVLGGIVTVIYAAATIPGVWKPLVISVIMVAATLLAVFGIVKIRSCE